MNQDNMNQDNMYQPPVVPTYGSDDTGVMATKDWLITLLILAIPCVGWIMYFVWAFGAGNHNRRNLCRAALILGAIGFALYIAFFVLIVVIGLLAM